MAVDTTQSWQEHTSDGSTAYFSFNFNYDTTRPGTIVVGKRTADNTYSVVDASNYELIPNASGDGGQIRFIQNPSGSQVIDDIPPAGTIVRIERVSVDTSSATWQIGLEMSELVNLFDRLFRLVQENKGGFDNVIKTFETQHNISLYELLSAHNNHLLYWDNTTHTLTPTDFPKEDVVRCVNGLFFRISTTQAGIPYLEWSANGSSDWHSTSATWGTIGGNINDQTDLKNALDAKQNTISDLSTIRSGAAKGATAVQPNDNITVLNNNAGYITASYHDATKQDLLVSGTNIKTVNGRDILGSGDITISSSVAWGNIQGTLTDQTDLKNALDLKADVATTYTKTEVNTALSGKANTDMDNLTDTGKNISNWSSNVSNCITEIPQDIKLELNNGTLTLKAGSKFYLPNGVNVFDVYTSSSDHSATNSNNGVRVVFTDSVGNLDAGYALNRIGSGATLPANNNDFSVFYNTTDGKMYTWQTDQFKVRPMSLPIAIVTISGGQITSIDQVFNGFGYVGSTVFALPGVKGLAPNGRNVDGTLKTIEMSLTSVFIGDISSSLPDDSASFLTTYSVFAWPVIVQDNEPEIHSGYEVWYSPKLNLAFYHAIGETSWTQRPIVMFGNVAKTATTFTKFEPGTPFRAVDYNDFANLSNEVVRTSGDQTISGTKTFTGSNEFKQTVKAPSVYGYGSDGVRTASLEFIDGGNDNIARLVAVSNNGNNATTADLHFNNGSPYFSVPSSDAVNAAVATLAKTKAQNGYFKLSNGLIVQWGVDTQTSSGNKTVNLPTAFSSATSYVVTPAQVNSTSTTFGVNIMVRSQSTTSFDWYSPASDVGAINWIAIGY